MHTYGREPKSRAKIRKTFGMPKLCRFLYKIISEDEAIGAKRHKKASPFVNGEEFYW